MRQKFKLILISILLLIFSSQLFAIQNNYTDPTQIDEKTGFPLILKHPFPVFDYGITSSLVTRIVKQTNRSNFVFEDFLVGVYCTMQSRNMEPFDSMIRLAAYYPLKYKFNGQTQPAVNMLNYAVDLVAAPFINLSFWNYITFDIGAGLHFLYQQGDRWHYANLGACVLARANMPISRRWTIFADGIASLDYGNFGTNARMEPYDFVWQYQVAVGVRYSIKSPNKYSYIPSKRTYEEELQILAEKAQLKKDKKAEKTAILQAKKEVKEKEKAAESIRKNEEDSLKLKESEKE